MVTLVKHTLGTVLFMVVSAAVARYLDRKYYSESPSSSLHTSTNTSSSNSEGFAPIPDV